MLPEVDVGTILIWQGAAGSIPESWVICDGNNGTPDLRNKFELAASAPDPVGSTGGAVSHDHDFTGDGHTHDYILAGFNSPSFGAPRNDIQGSESVIGTTEPGSSLPPYYSLAYIMKLS